MTKNELNQNPFLKIEASIYGYKVDFAQGSKEWSAREYPNDRFTDFHKFQKFLETKLKTDFAGDMLGTKVLSLLEHGRLGYIPSEIIGAKHPRSFIIRNENGDERSIYREGLCLDTPKNREQVSALKAIHDKYLEVCAHIAELEERRHRIWANEVEPVARRVKKIAFEAVPY